MQHIARRQRRVADRQSAGFTIIEVMIVLAIAGLIALLVFQAIPTLTRNGRNNQRKQDVGLMLQAVAHYELNNSGNFPTSSTTLLQFTNLNFYIPSQVVLTPGPGSPPPVTNVNLVKIYNYERCSDTVGAATSVGADYSNAVALFAVETGGGGAVSQCQQL